MQKIAILLLVLFSASAFTMQVPVEKKYNEVKTRELKTLLNKCSSLAIIPWNEIKQLISEDADQNVRADEGPYKSYSWFEALFRYGDFEDAEIMRFGRDLRQSSADLNSHPNKLLVSVCHSLILAKILFLIECHADIHGKNLKNETPLFGIIRGYVDLKEKEMGNYGLFSYSERQHIAGMLLKLGAVSDIDVANTEGDTPLSFAQKHNLTEMVELLEQYKKGDTH